MLLEQYSENSTADVDSADAVWDVYTYSANRFYLGSNVLKTSSVVTAEECAGLCADAGACWFWAWCPFNSSG